MMVWGRCWGWSSHNCKAWLQRWLVGDRRCTHPDQALLVAWPGPASLLDPAMLAGSKPLLFLSVWVTVCHVFLFPPPSLSLCWCVHLCFAACLRKGDCVQPHIFLGVPVSCDCRCLSLLCTRVCGRLSSWMSSAVCACVCVCVCMCMHVPVHAYLRALMCTCILPCLSVCLLLQVLV